MKTAKVVQILISASAMSLLFGCSEPEMPEVNDTNCKLENIKKLENRAMQQEFSSKCLRRSGGFRESSGESFTVQ